MRVPSRRRGNRRGGGCQGPGQSRRPSASMRRSKRCFPRTTWRSTTDTPDRVACSVPRTRSAIIWIPCSLCAGHVSAVCWLSIKKVVALCASPAAAQPTMGSPLQGLAEVPNRLVHRLSELLVRLQLVHELAEVRVRQLVFQGPSNAGAFAVAFDLESVRPALQEAARLAEAEELVLPTLRRLRVRLDPHSTHLVHPVRLRSCARRLLHKRAPPGPVLWNRDGLEDTFGRRSHIEFFDDFRHSFPDTASRQMGILGYGKSAMRTICP